jgi:hypothetical protein
MRGHIPSTITRRCRVRPSEQAGLPRYFWALAASLRIPPPVPPDVPREVALVRLIHGHGPADEPHAAGEDYW